MEHKYLFIAVDATLKVGEEILSICADPTLGFEIERKADGSPLTIADQKVHIIISTVLNEAPSPILSEEGRHSDYDTCCKREVLWIVDPLDGMKESIKRSGEFTVNITLVKAGVPIIGVIYLPMKKELYFAGGEIGAYKSPDITALEDNVTPDKLIVVSVRPLQGSRQNQFVVVASRLHLTPETETCIEVLKQKHGDVELVFGDSSIKICLIAEGKMDVYPRFAPTTEWDTATGHAIARAAGTEVYQVDKKNVPLQYNKENLLNSWSTVEKRG